MAEMEVVAVTNFGEFWAVWDFRKEEGSYYGYVDSFGEALKPEAEL